MPDRDFDVDGDGDISAEDVAAAEKLAEIERRRALYRTGPPVPLAGRDAIVVDDGIATGNTMRAALKALRRAGPARIVLAVPLAPADILASLRPLCDKVVCLVAPQPFYAVGGHYRDFSQTGDAEVIRLLAEAPCAPCSLTDPALDRLHRGAVEGALILVSWR